MNKIAKGLLIGTGATAAALGTAGAVSYVAARALIKITLDGKFNVNPSLRAKKFLSKCDRLDEMDKIFEREAKRLQRGDCISVEITAADGERLRGHFHYCPDAKRTVIAMHGWRTTWARDFGSASHFFHNNQCNVLYAEQRGQYGDGRIGFGITERHDCLCWIRFINSSKELSHLPIYLCGVSMGAATVLMTTGAKLPPNVVGVIADCGFTSPQAIWRHVTVNNLHFPYGKGQEKLIRRLCMKRMEMDPDEYSTTAALKNCKIPVLFIHGALDRFVPLEMTYENFSACASEKRLFIVPDAQHGMSYFVDRNGYETEVLRLWKECDRRI